MAYFSVLLFLEKIPFQIALPGIIILFASFLLAKSYFKYYLVHACVGCQKDLENGERYLLVVKGEVARACCDECYGYLPPEARKLYRKEER
jgi:hypothetical protein